VSKVHVLVLGSGVLGATTALYLARAGLQVTVMDRESGAGRGTSYGNAGEITPGGASPWAAPGLPMKVIGWLMSRHAPLILKPQMNLRSIRWLMKFAGNCDPDSYQRNRRNMYGLAEYSRQCLDELRSTYALDYSQRQLGSLQLYRTEKQVAHARALGAEFAELGLAYQTLDAAECPAVEPALASARCEISGGIRFPDDETGDCFEFTTEVQKAAEREGVGFKFGSTIDRLVVEGGRATGVVVGGNFQKADAIVVSLGSFTPQMLETVGLTASILPIKGYSFTAPIVDEALAPRSTVMDDLLKVAVTRLGDRVRVGGIAEVGGYDLKIGRRPRETLTRTFNELFGGAANVDQATFWSGLRPMAPDGTPYVGPTSAENLWVNSGHGTVGWTMACGSAKLLSDMMTGRRPDLDPSPYSPRR
jgi:D-amino-acid dehydrogenase